PPTNVPQGCGFLTKLPTEPFFPERFAADEKLMIETAEAFSRNEVLPLLERLDKQEDGLMLSLLKKAGELGFCGPDTPEAYGGLGLSKNLAARMLEFLSLNGSFSVTIGIHSGISQAGLVLFGNDEQKHRYLPRLASGENIGAYALSEPDAGTDALSLSARAVRHGDTYRLTGTKMWISNAKWADLFLVMAKVDGERLSAFLVERDYPGVTIGREEHKMGLKGSSTARVVLEDAEVPASNLLHQEGLGHQVALNALNLGRFKLAPMSLGPARDAIGLASKYVQERKQFGQPIARFGLIQRKFALMASLFFAAESMTYRTGALIDEAFAAFGGSIDGNRRAAEEFAVEASIGKVFVTEAESLIVDEALQCYGGYGFTEEFPIARHFRDARVSRIYEGTNEINRIFSAGRILRRYKERGLGTDLLKDSFTAELAATLLELAPEDQTGQAALADLVMLTYAEQSARLRMQKLGGISEELYRCFAAWANVRAAEAFQIATGEALSLPAAPRPDIAAINDAVHSAAGPACP
ncbi:MAG TPA: acyl-CoA dehydrogenase family protein, partial [Fimbriimonadaceae bacterium]|nr:acyl-CoA dehydrogenase family protein [Fimbriimonadaceae bacterium]